MATFPERMERRRERKRQLSESMASATPEERRSLIPVDSNPTEFEIQAYLFGELIRLGYHVRGEVATKCGTCVFDLVIYRDRVPIRIIEVKKCAAIGCTRKARRSEQRKRESQVDRYSAFGVPVDSVCNLSSAKDYIVQVSVSGLSI